MKKTSLNLLLFGVCYACSVYAVTCFFSLKAIENSSWGYFPVDEVRTLTLHIMGSLLIGAVAGVAALWDGWSE